MWVRWQSPQSDCHSPLQSARLWLSQGEDVAGALSDNRRGISGGGAGRGLRGELDVGRVEVAE